MGLHATDPATPYLSLWARVPGFRVADLDAALYDERTVAKHLAMRRTLWIFDVADLSAVQPAASDRVAANERKKLTADVVKSGVAADGDTWLETAAAERLRLEGESDTRGMLEVQRTTSLRIGGGCGIGVAVPGQVRDLVGAERQLLR